METFLFSDMFICVRTAGVYSRQSSYDEGKLTHLGSGVPTPGPQLGTVFAKVLETLGSNASLEEMDHGYRPVGFIASLHF